MFREMRRHRQQLSEEESLAILQKGSSGVLALLGDEGYPYAVPMSYVYHEGKLYFHSSLIGHKIDAVWSCGKASFCVVAEDTVLPEAYTTAYRSVIVFGQIRILPSEEEKRRAALLLGEKYNPGHPEATARELDAGLPRMHVLELTVEHMTGKEGLELAKARAIQ